AEEELAAWRADWGQLLVRIGLSGELSPAEATAELALVTELLKDYDEAQILQKRVAGIDRDAVAFSKEVGDFCQLVAPDLADRPVVDVVDRLAERLEAAQTDRTRSNALVREQAQARERLAKIGEARALAAAAIELLCE